MKLSARNMLKGKIVKIMRGAVNAEVIIQLAGGEQVVSIITNESVDSLALKEGKLAFTISQGVYEQAYWSVAACVKLLFEDTATTKIYTRDSGVFHALEDTVEHGGV